MNVINIQISKHPTCFFYPIYIFFGLHVSTYIFLFLIKHQYLKRFFTFNHENQIENLQLY